jgi:hypothetical protein
MAPPTKTISPLRLHNGNNMQTDVLQPINVTIQDCLSVFDSVRLSVCRSYHTYIRNQKYQVALTGIRTTVAWIAGVTGNSVPLNKCPGTTYSIAKILIYGHWFP